jgi:hypothetical protein
MVLCASLPAMAVFWGAEKPLTPDNSVIEIKIIATSFAFIFSRSQGLDC